MMTINRAFGQMEQFYASANLYHNVLFSNENTALEMHLTHSAWGRTCMLIE